MKIWFLSRICGDMEVLATRQLAAAQANRIMCCHLTRA